MTVFKCVAYEHNHWLVLLAIAICFAGSWVAARLFKRGRRTTGMTRAGWQFLAGLAGGVSTWCTHFVGMLGFLPGAPVSFDPLLTALSALVAVLGVTTGFIIAGRPGGRSGPPLGGAVVGLSVAAMHYTGMLAYRVQGLVTWNSGLLVFSIACALVLGALALQCGVRMRRRGSDMMALLLALGIVLLHFIGMSAFSVQPLGVANGFSNPEAFQVLALAIALMSTLVVAAGLVSYLIDDQSRSENVERLRQMALTDTLTDLPNRSGFDNHIDRELALAKDQRTQVALIGIDLNRFKEINDLRGHKTGDDVLRVLGHRLKSVIRPTEGEFVARVGGDEFAALMRLDGTHDLGTFLERLEAVLHKPIRLEDYEISPGASLGVALFPDDAHDRETLVQNADLAMYRAKNDLSQRICYYEKDMDELVKARRRMSVELRDAIVRDELEIHYQVQTLVVTGETLGYEALLRWNHGPQGYIPPGEFIPLAEQTGAILELGEWVLRRACADAALWAQPYTVAVNLSAVQFNHSDLPKLIRDVLEETGLAPHRLELELTESTVFADGDRARNILRQIKALGVKVALDDFGTGYSSLDTLLSFPFDKIKIDRAFVHEALTNPQTIAIIRAILALGHGLGLSVLAEGIESEDQLNILEVEGCTEGQGFLLGRPQPMADLVAAGHLVLRPGAGERLAQRPPPDELMQA
ncbi:EAL domain-containing protein [Pseudooceanicola sp. CBS1P-1]|nr:MULTISPECIES: bifunctional diguanylate cyclase/phosphodiesterase [Pseudooceanicola]MBT9383011.1 EAL domain-containing protein [Pseudooceanicola endophyticus]